jgi:hypothetical protein
MRWFRSNAGRDAWLALFALACQFVFTFGHIHLSRIGVSDTLMITDGAPAVPGSRGAPSGFTDFCALCSNINLAGTLVLPPAVAPPKSFVKRLQRTPAADSSTRRDHRFFDARGPPYA